MKKKYKKPKLREIAFTDFLTPYRPCHPSYYDLAAGPPISKLSDSEKQNMKWFISQVRNHIKKDKRLRTRGELMAVMAKNKQIVLSDKSLPELIPGIIVGAERDKIKVKFAEEDFKRLYEQQPGPMKGSIYIPRDEIEGKLEIIDDPTADVNSKITKVNLKMKTEKEIQERLKRTKKELEFRREAIREMRKNPESMDKADKEIFRDYVDSDRVLDNEIITLEWVLGKRE